MLRILQVLQLFFVSIVHCERRFIVAPGHSTCSDSTWSLVADSVAGEEVASCSGLSELLTAVSSNIVPGDNVIISVEGDNDYNLNNPSYFVVPNVSIAIKGVPRNNSKPRIACNSRALKATNTLYTLRFNRSNSVIIDQLEFVGCPRSLSFVDMLNLTITNSLFRFVM